MKINRKIRFAKMHGAGNDYVYIEALKEMPDNLTLLSQLISSRHFGVGSDGLVAILPSEVADFRMRMFNADGSEAQMCGNASRCIGKYLYEKGLTDKKIITLETLAGIRTLYLEIKDGMVKNIEVDMSVPVLSPGLIPVISEDDSLFICRNVEIDGRIFPMTAVSMGNPHGVIFTDEITDDLVLRIGPMLENADIWPEKANIEFVRVITPRQIEMRVWERGSGETLACGTGASASVVAAVLNGLTERSVDVKLRGGKLSVRWDDTDGHVYLRGDANFIAEGEFYIPENISMGK